MKKLKLSSLHVLSLLSVLLILAISPSFAQSYRTFSSELDEIIRNAKWKIGPFRIHPIIRFRDIGYDDNVYRKRQEDNPISDYTATVSPRLNTYLLFRNWLILSFSENPEYVFFLKERRERSFNNNFSPQIKILLFQRFVLSGNYQFRRARRRASSEFDLRAVEQVKGYNGSFFYETARRTSFGISGSLRNVSYEDITLPAEVIYLSLALDRQERSGKFELYYRIFSGSFFFAGGQYTKYNFEHIQSQWRNSYSYQLYSGIRFPVLGRIRGMILVGYKILTPENIWRKGFSGIVGNTSLDLRIRRFGFRIGYSRDCQFSFYLNNVFFLEDIIRPGISFYLTNFLRLDYDFTYGESYYPESILVYLPNGTYKNMERNDIYRIHTAGFVVRIVRNFGIGIRYNYWVRESTIPYIGDRNRWILGGYVTYEF